MIGEIGGSLQAPMDSLRSRKDHDKKKRGKLFAIKNVSSAHQKETDEHDRVLDIVAGGRLEGGFASRSGLFASWGNRQQRIVVSICS
jgi:hypothetical protein